MTPRHIFAATLAALAFLLPGHSSAAELVDSAKLDALVKPLVNGGWLHGVAIGLVNEKGTQIVGYGSRSAGADASTPGADTVFEIGSVSKTFTGLLLAQMVEDHVVELITPVQKLLGDSMTVPKSDDREITLVELATHSSGLPRMPTNFHPKDPMNPYADYTVDQMKEYLAKCKLEHKPGEVSAYSNLGMGLLGHSLALKSGMSYEDLLHKRICEPLGLGDTSITLDDAHRARLAEGHDSDGEPVANWDIPTLAGAGAIRSTAADMAKYVAAQLGLPRTSFDPAVVATHAIHFKDPNGTHDVGLAWQISGDDQVIWHNGQTGGYHSYVGFSPRKKAGVIVLSNSAASQVDALGSALLELLTTGTAKPLKLPWTIKLDGESLEPLVGSYKLGPLATVTITREGEQLLMQLTGQPKIKFYPESKTRFFCRVVDAAVTFEADPDGKISQLMIHQNGRDLPAPKVK